VRRIHIDRSPKSADQELPDSSPPEVSDDELPRAKEFQDAITRIVRQGDTMSPFFFTCTTLSADADIPPVAVREKIDEIRTWLKGQARDEVCIVYPIYKYITKASYAQHLDLRASFLLLYRYTDLQRQDLELQRELQKAQCDLEEADKVAAELRAELAAHREEADAKYEKLVRSSREEKTRAVAMEKAKRDHAEKMEREWKQ
jgi:hypothetical protein